MSHLETPEYLCMCVCNLFDYTSSMKPKSCGSLLNGGIALLSTHDCFQSHFIINCYVSSLKGDYL